jgi:hypothetical protein
MKEKADGGRLRASRRRQPTYLKRPRRIEDDWLAIESA